MISRRGRSGARPCAPEAGSLGANPHRSFRILLIPGSELRSALDRAPSSLACSKPGVAPLFAAPYIPEPVATKDTPDPCACEEEYGLDQR